MEALQSMDEYQSKSGVAIALFEKHFLPFLKERGIDGNLGSGQQVLYDLELAVPNGISWAQEIEIGENLRILALCMASAFEAEKRMMAASGISWDTGRMHETTYEAARFTLCPLFPFSKEPCERHGRV